MKKALTIFAGIALLTLTALNVSFARQMVCSSAKGSPSIFEAGSFNEKTLNHVCGFENQTSLKASH